MVQLSTEILTLRQQLLILNWQQLQQMAQNGQLTQNTHVWKQGMAAWEIAANVQELVNLFGTVPPPPPPPVV